MLQLRLYALYNCSRRIAIIVGSVFLVYLSAFIGILSFASYNHFGQRELFPLVPSRSLLVYACVTYI